MQDYSTSFAISRRDFLKTLIAASGALLLPSATQQILSAQAAPPSSLPQSNQPPFWWLCLKDNVLHGPSHAKAAFGLPGSLMKLVTATALMEERLISPDEKLECRGTLRLGGQTFRCQHAHGKIRLKEALAASCNIYFAQAAEVLSTRRFLQYAEAFQLNQPTGKGEGYLFPDRFAYNHPSQLYVLGLSRNLQPNTSQLIRMTRHISRKDLGFKAQTWQVLQGGMRLAATQGTARKLDPGNTLRVAAKTGTAPYGTTYQSWVIGYFPFEKPRYIFCTRSVSGTAMDAAIPQASRYLQAHHWT